MLPQDISGITASQKAFFADGKTRSVAFRLAALQQLRLSVRLHSDEICRALWLDLHKSETESYLTEISVVLGEIDDHIRHLKNWTKPKKVATPLVCKPSRSYIIYEPYGVVSIISPWNYPFQLLIDPLVGAISAGNCALLKPSDQSPNTASVISKIITEAFPSNYVAVLEGGHDVVGELLKQPVDYIFFTGSTSFGRQVMKAASDRLIPVTLELGGKSPCIVGEGADMGVTGRRIAWGKFLNAGQTCVAPDYILVRESDKKALIDSLRQSIIRFYGEDPETSPDYGRIVSLKSAERLAGFIRDSGKVVYGGKIDLAQKYISPTLLGDVLPVDPVMQEEIFGPVLPILTYSTIGEAVDFVNSREKPLALYYFGSKDEAAYVISHTSSGGVCINDTVMHLANGNLPFGGVGASGMGRYHGKESFLLFSNVRALLKSTFKIDLPLRYPPYLDKLKWLKRFV